MTGHKLIKFDFDVGAIYKVSEQLLCLFFLPDRKHWYTVPTDSLITYIGQGVIYPVYANETISCSADFIHSGIKIRSFAKDLQDLDFRFEKIKL